VNAWQLSQLFRRHACAAQKYEHNWIHAPLEPALLIPCFATVYESGLGGRLDLIAKRNEMEFLSEFWLYMRTRKKFWLLPLVVCLGLFGGLVVLTKGTAIAPFVYTLF
jgi:hypothetical protein